MPKPAIQIDDLTRDERLDLLDQIWDSLNDEDVPLTEAQREELDRRLERFDTEGPVGVSWEQVRGEMGDSVE